VLFENILSAIPTRLESTTTKGESHGLRQLDDQMRVAEPLTL